MDSFVGLGAAMFLGSLVGLTFGAMEQVGYASDKEWAVWLARSFTSVPYHALSGAVLGYSAPVAVWTRRRWGRVALAVLVLVHGLADWPFIDMGGGEPLTQYGFVNTGWAGNLSALVVVAVLAAVFARIARKADVTQAEPAAAADGRGMTAFPN
jgi:hypothetical protein